MILKAKGKSFLLIFLVFLIAFSPDKVLAVSTSFYSSNDILFYDPNESNCAGSTASSDSVSISESATTKTIFQLLINGGMNAVQAAAIMGNMQAESGFKSKSQEVGGGGYGLAQWTGGRRTNLEAYAKSKGVTVDNLEMQVEFLLKEYNDSYKKGLSSTAFNNATNIADATEAWMNKFERPAAATAHLSRRITAAQKIYSLYSSLAPSSTTTGSVSGCGGVVAGDIVQTAINFALSSPQKNQGYKPGDYSQSTKDANPAYISALEQYNKGGNPADCGIFVATVMIASGADKNYPKAGTASQLQYVQDNSNYQIINSPKQSQLQPGDILIVNNGSNHHTQIYTGNSPYPAVDASQDDRVPSVREESSLSYMLGLSGVIAARLVK